MAEHPSYGLLGFALEVTTRRIWEQCAVLSTEAGRRVTPPRCETRRDELTTLTLRPTGHARHQRVVPPAHPDSPIELTDLEPVRLAAEPGPAGRAGDRADFYPRTLQALAVANACNVIAERLTGPRHPALARVRVHGPAE